MLKGMGLSEKAAKVYIAALSKGEATILDLAKDSGVTRTTIYYVLNELIEKGLLSEVKRGKKTYYMYTEPELFIKEKRMQIMQLDELEESLKEIKYTEVRKPHIEFYFGPAGFKEVWFKVFHSGEKSYRIITDGKAFLGFVKEKYILEDIINEKKKLQIKSKQLILDSSYARSIIVKDQQENRESKLLPPEYPISFTEIITENFVATISTRNENVIFTIDNPEYAQTRKHLFDALWESL
jgi:sugar-specific transcriptional regulator TrmB